MSTPPFDLALVPVFDLILDLALALALAHVRDWKKKMLCFRAHCRERKSVVWNHHQRNYRVDACLGGDRCNTQKGGEDDIAFAYERMCVFKERSVMYDYALGVTDVTHRKGVKCNEVTKCL